MATEDSKSVTKTIFNKQICSLMGTVKEGKTAVDNIHFLFGDVLAPQELIAKIEERCTECAYDAIIVDSFGDVFSGKDGNNNAEVRNALRPFYAIASSGTNILGSPFSTCKY